MSMTKLATVAFVALLGASTSACVISDGTGNVDPIPAPDPFDTVYTSIEPDYVLNTDLGYGTGLFVEYTAGGDWEVWTSCDTRTTGATCDFEVNITATRIVSNLQELELEASDHVQVYNDNTLGLVANTASGSDALRFSTEPGTSVEIELLLDGAIAPEYLVWFSNGQVNDGANGSPVVFQPAAP